MALSLDDKLLGEKTHYYCSSSEDEGDQDEDALESKEALRGSGLKFTAEEDLPKHNYNGSCTNTGPKGVIEDWRRFKQLETEKREEQEVERLELSKKLSMTCRSQLDEEREAEKDQRFLEQVELELGGMEDEFLKEYRRRRIDEMRGAMDSVPRFGVVYQLGNSNFSESIDKEKPNVTVVVHVYEDRAPGCDVMNQSLSCLAHEYPTVKFCKIKASHANLSHKFSVSGVPALLIYKNKELIGNFVRITSDLGDEFYASDVEGFLVEHGMLPDKTIAESIVRSTAAAAVDSDSDFDVD